MAKWISPLFTDIRNKLGDSVVFSMWKGRPYFRAYVIPANPKTNKQQANRDVLRKLVERYLQIIATADEKAVWNAAALSLLISGYNLFCKYGRKTNISCIAGVSSGEIDVTYTLGLAAAQASLLLYGGVTPAWLDETPAEGLEAGADKEVTVSGLEAGEEYECYIATDECLIDAEEQPQDYTAFTRWEPDIVNGIAKEAKCTATT